MAVLLTDDFTGANGALVDAAKWGWRPNAGEAAPVIQNNAAYWDNGTAAACGALVASAAPADGEVYAELTLTKGVIAASNDQIFSIGVRSDPADTATGPRGHAVNGTVIYLDTYTRIVTLRRYLGGSFTSLATFTLPTPAHTAGTLLKVRVRYEGRRFQVRVWRNAEPEPDTWQIDYTGTEATVPRLTGQVLVGARCRTNYEMSVDNVGISDFAAAGGSPAPQREALTWTGTSWEPVLYWDGTAWVPLVGEASVWDGSSWEPA